MARISLTLAALAQLAAVSAWQWPSAQLERLDTLRWDQMGVNQSPLGTFTSPCSKYSFSGTGGRSNAADWLRTAYHDMATFNKATGAGGLDASIQFATEQNRPENVGDGFSNTIQVIDQQIGRYVSLADLIALAAVFAVEQCAGPQIDFKGGRIDATVANSPGVPEPQDTLATHIADFQRQGFTQSEMISLIACGHTLGGVQGKFFPTVVQPPSSVPTTNTETEAHFDSTFDNFDNKIATEWIAGTTQDPLVVTPNVTMRSDQRIFGSDNNVTMQSLASSQTTFFSTCSSLFARMLNTVPTGVTLTEVLQPQPAKPDSISLIHNTNGSLTLLGRVRFWNLAENSARTVNLKWAAQTATTACSGCSVALTHDSTADFSTSAAGTHKALFYKFPVAGALLPSSVGTNPKFWFESTESGSTTVFNQNGAFFPLQTQVLVASTSCIAFNFPAVNPTRVSLDIAVRKNLSPSLVYVEGDLSSGGFPVPGKGSWAATLNTTKSAADPNYNVYSVTLADPDVNGHVTGQNTMTVGATINGQNVSDWTFFGAAQPTFNAWIPRC